jgi:hypothetical protein
MLRRKPGYRADNLGTEDAFEYNMFVGPQGRPIGVSIPNNEHRCGPLSTVEECKDGGWATFNHPAPFGDQGACVAYVNHRERITLLVPEDPIRFVLPPRSRRPSRRRLWQGGANPPGESDKGPSVHPRRLS